MQETKETETEVTIDQAAVQAEESAREPDLGRKLGDYIESVTNISAYRGPKQKVNQLTIAASPEFKLILKAIYDPFITYGVTKISPWSSVQTGAAGPLTKISTAASPEPVVLTGTMSSKEFKREGITLRETFEVLDKLAKRELSGHAAKAALDELVSKATVPCHRMLELIIGRSMGADVGVSLVNKAIPGCIREFNVMLAHKYEQKRIKKFPVRVEPKLDGVRVLCLADLGVGDTLAERIEGGSVAFLSRTGKDFTSFGHLKAPILEMLDNAGLTSFVFDGEVVSGHFNDTVSAVRSGSENAVDAEFHIFDGMLKEQFIAEKCPHTLTERRAILSRFQMTDKIKLLPSYIANSHVEVQQMFKTIFEGGGEGVIVKAPAGLYEFKRSHNWLKIKGEESVDCIIIGAEEGTGQIVGQLGALVVDVEGVKVNVGSGLSAEQRQNLWVAHSYGNLVGRCVEVEYHEKTPDGSLRHPRFKRFRDDKQEKGAAVGGAW